MSSIGQETILSVRHWNDTLFSFTATRDPGLRFHNGHFVMIGLETEGKPLMRAYSIVSANYEEHLEFFSIKVQDGPLTSKLQHLKPGDKLMVSRKPTGTLIMDNLLPGKTLYMLATGTGLAPFMSIIKDPEVYERYDNVVLCHGVREVSELAYAEYISSEIHDNEFFGAEARKKLIYYPTVTREAYRNQGRLTDLIENGKLASDIGLPPLNADTDRVMICGSPSMIKDLVAILEARGFTESRHGHQAHYVIERAFVEK